MTVLPGGRAVRRWTRRRAWVRDPALLSDLLADVYNALLTVAIVVAMVLGGAAGLGADLAARPGAEGAGLGLRVGWLVLLGGAGAVLAVVALAARLGPVGVRPSQAAWWLPLPVERRGLLRPAAAIWPAVSAGVGTVAGLAAVLVVASGGSAPLLLAGATGGAGLAASAVLAVGLAQVTARGHRRARVLVDVLLAVVPVVGIVVASVDLPPPASTPVVLWGTAAGAVLLAGSLAVVLDARLPRLSDAILRERGFAAGEALAATLSTDTRALGRALSAQAAPLVRRSSSFRWLAPVPRRFAPHAALVTADALLLLRSPRHLAQLLVSACLPAVALAVPSPVPVVTVLLLVVGAYAAGLAVTEAARRAEDAPVLDALLPVGAETVRRLRLVTPSGAHLVWSLAVFALLTWRYGGAEWLALGALGAPGWAAGAVRAAYRPPPDFSGGLVHTPMGAFPPGALSVVSKGPDVALLCAAPALLAVLTGTISPPLLWLQAALTAVALAVAAHVPRT
ncbi:DUF6297 family protein [Georgenia alba]|uniref:DUF6297 family protein n=1 Tax=Georgenia alba TaxID=2233858 RepID=A0ABW2Q9S7_9MICO